MDDSLTDSMFEEPTDRSLLAREWLFVKILHCIEAGKSKASGILLVGGPGSGKTTALGEIARPSESDSRQAELNRRLIANYHCDPQVLSSLRLSNFILDLVDQLSACPLLTGYRDRLENPEVVAVLQPSEVERFPDEAFKKAVLFPLLETEPPEMCCVIIVDGIDETGPDSERGLMSHSTHTARSSTAVDSSDANSLWSESISQLLSVHHQLFPPWLMLVCSARRQSRTISRLFTGFRKDVYQCLWGWDSELTREGLLKTLKRLSKIVSPSSQHRRRLRIFHQSFAEWLCDVKHCTQRFLCKPQVGHAMWALRYSTLCKATDLTTEESSDLWHHLRRTGLSQHYQAMWQSHCTGEPLRESTLMYTSVSSLGATDNHALLNNSLLLENKVVRLLLEACSAPNLKRFKSCVQLDEMDNDEVTSVSELATSLLEESQLASLAPDTVDEAEPSSQRTLLHRAAEEGDLQLVARLVEMGAAIENADRNGQTPLNLAARQGHLQVLEALLRAGAAVDRADVDGWTPLRSSAWAGHAAVVDALLQFGARVDLADADGRTALRAAAWGGHDDIVMRLLKAGAAVNARDAEGRTALIAAAYMGHSAIVGHLLDAGADINHADKDGRTALSVAALCVPASQGHHAAVVSLLLERGAEVDHRDSEAMTALLVAAFEGHAEVCELLLEGGADVDHADATGRTPLFAAASMGHAHVVKRLLFWGAYVDSIDSEGRTVLSVAAAQGNSQTVECLLDRGLDELHRDNAGWTALHYAAFEGHAQVCQLLMQAGAKPNEVDTDGRTPLILSAQEGHSACVQLFIQSCPRILEHRSHDGRTALRMAAMEGHKETVDLLLGFGADVNYQDADGRTTLYLLALEGNVSMLEHLIGRGADVEAVDLEGRTALHVAAWQGHVHVVDLLLRRGAHVDAVDREMRSALQSAAWQGHADVVRLLIEQDASVNHVCNQGASALGIAAQEGHASVVRVLLAHGADVHHSDLCGRTPARVALKAGHQEVAALIEAYGGNSQSGRSSSSNVSGEGAERTERLERATAAAPRAVPRTLLQPANRDSFAESVTTGSESGVGEQNVSFTAMIQRRASQTSSTCVSREQGSSFQNLRRTKIVTNPNFIGGSSKKKETPI
ncbi:ankyrin repeat domain-containing protein 50-like isoform X2 [Varroa destructor]|uniref:TANC1/2-like winged helix domain-containing protein n=1 Tax=Varroa destructor TaxID=109461 RepID=A0A7M7K8W1_VARDE|nr:ankyrin repeat domain-containing protein 50-like isoform X2 [Varroa destructor]